MSQVFSCKFCKISKNTFLIEHLRETAFKYQYVHRYHSRQHIIALKTEITLWHECSPVNLLHISRASCPKFTSVRLPLNSKLIRKRKERPQFRNRLEMFSRKCFPKIFFLKCHWKKDSSASFCPLNFRKYLKIPILFNSCERLLSTTSINADWSTLNDTHMCFTESSIKTHWI